jgi:hypothetical protein
MLDSGHDHNTDHYWIHSTGCTDSVSFER